MNDLKNLVLPLVLILFIIICWSMIASLAKIINRAGLTSGYIWGFPNFLAGLSVLVPFFFVLTFFILAFSKLVFIEKESEFKDKNPDNFFSYPRGIREEMQRANDGDALSQYNLGIRFERGTFVGRDYAEAVKWFLKAAKQGHADASFHLGEILLNGNGVLKNSAEALRWFTLAAKAGNADAQCKLGLEYLTSNVLEINVQKAYFLLNLAAANGLRKAIVERDKLEKRMLPSEILEAQKLSAEWMTENA